MTLKLARLVTACGRLAKLERRREPSFELDAVLDEIVAAFEAIDKPQIGGAS